MVLRPGQCGDLALVAELSLGKAPDSLARATASALVRVWIITCREGRLADAQYSKRAIGIVKLSGVQLFSGTSRHHAERRSGSEDLFCDLIPHLKSGGNFGAVIGGGHPVAGWAEVRRNATE